jgi:hypothetical protein
MSGELTNPAVDDRAHLTIITRNATPEREDHYPCTWVVCSGGQTIRVQVAHDSNSRPYVEFRCAA